MLKNLLDISRDFYHYHRIIQGSQFQASSRPLRPKNKWEQPKIEALLSSWLPDFCERIDPKKCSSQQIFWVIFLLPIKQQYEN